MFTFCFIQSEKLQVRNDELQSEMKKVTVSQVSSVLHTYVSSYVYTYITFYMCSVLCVFVCVFCACIVVSNISF